MIAVYFFAVLFVISLIGIISTIIYRNIHKTA